ncbi:MAG: YfiR family protein [Nitrospinae bacterium]|nr:YfiR family protein [Nitrospinota bacterium]
MTTGAHTPRRFAANLTAMFAAVWTLTSGIPAAPQEGVFHEGHVKAAFLYKLTLYIEWPEQAFSAPGDPVVIAVVGDDPFAAILEETVEGKVVRGRTFKVRRYAWPGDVLPPSHIVFIGPAYGGDRLVEAARKVRGQVPHALVAADARGAGRQGATLFFTADEKKVGFSINVDQASRAGLTISSKLLRIAEIIREDER